MADICNYDFEEIFDLANEGDLVYCDPPYLNNFSSYDQSGFTLQDHKRLLDKAMSLKNSGVTTIISNSLESKDLYSKCQSMSNIEVMRSVGSTSSSRGYVCEILVMV